MIRSVLFFIFGFPLIASAQFSYVVDQSIPVSDENGNNLSLAWAGGLNAAQYNTIDLNGDGKDDLAIFDRTADKVITFINMNNEYIYASDYEELFPGEVTNWMLLRDFNCDGLKDIFTSDLFGIKVFVNVTVPGENPTWEKFYFHSANSRSEVILTKGFTSKINLQIQYDDLPSITDMDGDGDLDILNIKFPSGSTVEFHKNYSIERYGTCDSLDFERITQTWGGFEECSCGDYAFNGTDCPTGGRVKHAGGKTLLALDVDGDSDQDLLLSEASCIQLYYLKNTGTVQDALITSDSPFPLPTPVFYQIFPAAFYEDVDFDGVKDLISSPSIYANEFPVTAPDLARSNWFYKNTGTNSQPAFTFMQENFLQEHMIDVGDYSTPAFADYDNDGDLDMFISQFTSSDFVAKIILYKNTGTATEPAFQLETDDYLRFSILNLFNVRLQWADINGDAKTDLVFSSTSFQTGTTSVSFLPNKSSGAFDFDGQSVESTNFTMARFENAYFTDVNKDGALDILLGKSNGALFYYRNTGEPGTFNYSLDDDSFLDTDINVLSQNPRVAVGDLDADGNEDIILADQSGQLRIIADYRNASATSEVITDVVYNNLSNSYTSPNLGGRILPEIANIYNSDKPSIIVGNIMGGVQVLRHDGSLALPENPVVRVYPVPADHLSQDLFIRVDRTTNMEVYTTLGQRIGEPVTFSANVINEFDLEKMTRGTYILRFTSNNKSTIKRIVVY